MNVSKQELDGMTRTVIAEIDSAKRQADTALFLNSKDQMEIACRRIDAVLERVIDFRDKYKLPAILADEPYRKARQTAKQKEIKELSDRLASNQSEIERLQQHNNSIQSKLQQLQEAT